jgi:lysozyme
MHTPGIRVASWLVVASLAACGPAGRDAPDPVGTAAEASTTVCPTATVEGLDVADGQGTIDWGSVQGSGRVFAFIKATQGNYFTSSTFQDQWTGAAAAGLMRSPYHFFDPTVDGTAQAQYFLEVVGQLGPNDLPPMLDIECPTDSDESQTQSDCEYGGSSPDSGWAPGATITQGIQDFITYVRQQTGRGTIIYSYNDWFEDSGVDGSTLLPYPLFISWPTSSSCYEVGLGNDFTSAVFWQWSVTGSCPGVSGQVDLDRFNGTLADLQTFAALNGPGSGGGGAGGSGGTGGTTGSGGGGGAGASTSTGSGKTTSASAGSGTGGGASGAHAGCSCRLGEPEETPVGALLLGIAGLIAARRRRYRAS